MLQKISLQCEQTRLATPRKLLSINTLEIPSSWPQSYLLILHSRTVSLIEKHLPHHFSVQHAHLSQIVSLQKTKGTASKHRNKRKRCINKIAVFVLRQPLQSFSRKQTAQLCRLLFLSKVYIQTRNQVLLLNMS